MKKFLLLLIIIAAVAVFFLKPADNGGPYDTYFQQLDAELKARGPAHPSLVLDLDRLDHNIREVLRSIGPDKHLRIVAKSLPSLPLLKYISDKAQTQRLMLFHQPFVNLVASQFPKADILLGKPMPVRAAEQFYEQHKNEQPVATPERFNPARQLQWLIDTPERLNEYLALARFKELHLKINIEIDVGLHRGGVADTETLDSMLKIIEANPYFLEFAGFMGYEPHIVKVPPPLGNRDTLFAQVINTYQSHVDHVRQNYPTLWHDDLTLNGAGSTTYKLYESDQLINDLSIGSGLVMPTDFDLDTLAEHQPALFIATPVLKKSKGIRMPGAEFLSPLLEWWDPNMAQTFFIYGGYWKAQYANPPGLQHNSLYGRSTNQEIVNGSDEIDLDVDDYVFLRPTQSEAVMLQFGDLVVVRNGISQGRWPVFRP